MAVLITGGAGFVGFNLVEALVARGEQVVVYGRDDLPPAASEALASLSGTCTLVKGDVLDKGAVTAVFQDHKIDRVFPFAAITAGPAREATAADTVFRVNLEGNLIVLAAARDAGVGRIVFPSSNSVYGESFQTFDVVREADTPCVPANIYGVTKYAGERMALRLKELWSLDIVCARISSVFGPWERDTGMRDMLSPHMQLAQMALKGEAAVLPATILPRPWIYSRDIADGLIALLDAPRRSFDVYNVSTGAPWGPLLLEFPKALAAAFPDFSWRQSDDPTSVNLAFHESRPRGYEDNSRIRTDIGWAPKFGPAEAYADYVAWTKANPAALAR